MTKTICVLSIAGSDCSAGAGLQGDLKTFSALGGFGLTVATVVTSQNTRKLFTIQEIDSSVVYSQLDALFDDFHIKAVKIGVIYSIKIAETIIPFMQKHNNIPWIIDPVMSSSAKGGDFMKDHTTFLDFIKNNIFPLATLITPNIPELYILTGDNYTNHKIKDKEKIKEKLVKLSKSINNIPILLKGGHYNLDDTEKKYDNVVEDILYDGEAFISFCAKRVETKNTHGTGCALASAIALHMGEGYLLQNAITKAKHFVTKALECSFDTGYGNGSINHFWNFCNVNN